MPRDCDHAAIKLDPARCTRESHEAIKADPKRWESETVNKREWDFGDEVLEIAECVHCPEQSPSTLARAVLRCIP